MAKTYRALILDKDGTICRSKSGKDFVNSADDQELIPGVRETLTHFRELYPKVPFLIASNQGGVAFGQITMQQASDCVNAAIKEIGGTLAVFCPEHPEGTVPPYNVESDYRKPKPGMLLFLLNEVGIGPGDALMIGDRPEDEQAAIAAGTDFEWADKFFGRDEFNGG